MSEFDRLDRDCESISSAAKNGDSWEDIKSSWRNAEPKIRALAKFATLEQADGALSEGTKRDLKYVQNIDDHIRPMDHGDKSVVRLLDEIREILVRELEGGRK